MSPLPEWVVPMAATLTQERFTGPEWLFERKFDGIRLLAFKRGSQVQLYSRNRLLQDIPPVAAAIAKSATSSAELESTPTREPATCDHASHPASTSAVTFMPRF